MPLRIAPASSPILVLTLVSALVATAGAPSTASGRPFGPVRRPTGTQPAPLPQPGAQPHAPGHHPVVVPPALTYPDNCQTPTTNGEILTLRVEAPVVGTTVTSYGSACPPTVNVDGTAAVGRTLFDFYFVIDSSGSTGRCTGSDINGNGVVGVDSFPFGCTDPGDSVLGAEVAAVRGFVNTLSPLNSRVSIIQFSDPDFGLFGGRQLIVQDLTSDMAAVNLALDTVLGFGAAGSTDYGGGLGLLETEYFSHGDPVNRRQYAYFLSDGVPTFPAGNLGVEDPGDSQWALDAADRLAREGIRVDTFGVGFIPSTTRDPIVPPRCLVTRPSGVTELTSTLECVALRTGGVFFASTNPADIIDELRRREPAGIQQVVVTNETNGASVTASLSPDGRYTADVPVEQGVINVLDIVATAADGTTCEVQTDYLILCYADGCSPLTQGYWHRQCLGLGLIPTNGSMPPHPDWDPQVLLRLMTEIVDPQVRALGSPADPTTCDGLNAVPPDDMCQKAIKQWTAVLMNIAGGHLSPTCVISLPGSGDMTPTTAAAYIERLIQDGLAGNTASCALANDLADSINTGASVH